MSKGRLGEWVGDKLERLWKVARVCFRLVCGSTREHRRIFCVLDGIHLAVVC